MRPLLAAGHAGLLHGNTAQWARCIFYMHSGSDRYHHEGRKVHSRAVTALWTAAAAGAVAFTSCEAEAPVNDGSSASQSEKAAYFRAWVSRNGGDASAVDVARSKDPSAGNALFATPEARSKLPSRWLGSRLSSLLPYSWQQQPLATIPLHLAVTLEAAFADPDLGPSYRELYQLGVAGEREVVILMLMVERLRWSNSKWAPWLQQLPHTVSTPLTFSEVQLKELAGTNLAAAATALRRASEARWKRLAPAAADLLSQVGVTVEPSMEDWFWAVGAFWSRAQSIPVPIHAQQQGGPSVAVLEGIVPGVDLCNHSNKPSCWWDVHRGHPHKAPKGGSPPPPQITVRLMTYKPVHPEDELTISYGDKGNEELLLLYGFALAGNPHETLMLPCPLPSRNDWGPDTTSRVQLLQARGLKPQLFLSREHLAALPPAPEPLSSSRGSSRSSSSQAPQGMLKQAQVREQHLKASCLPEAARRTLEVFVLELAAVERELEEVEQVPFDEEKVETEELQQQQQQCNRGGGSGSTSSSSSSSSRNNSRVQLSKEAGSSAKVGAGRAPSMGQLVDQLGLDMALITTFVRLLELQLLQLEGPEGTGPLEADLDALHQLQDQGSKQAGGPRGGAAADAWGKGGLRAQGSTTGARQGGEEQGGRTDDGGASWLQACLLYRAGQKELVRGYLVRARAELSNTMVLLAAAVREEEEGAASKS